jgi:hypothetical protein
MIRNTDKKCTGDVPAMVDDIFGNCCKAGDSLPLARHDPETATCRSTDFKYNKMFPEENYLINYCENIFEKLNYREKALYKNMPERMVFETEIWIIGENIRQGILNEIKNKTNNYKKIIENILKIINTNKYKTGRESFVMLLSYYKNDNGVKNLLEKLLDDKELYGFAIKELDKIKEYRYINKIIEIYNNERNGWKKQAAKKYIEKANKIIK